MIQMCPDFASPEASVVCPPHQIGTPLVITPTDLLPVTGLDVALIIVVALLFLAAGYWLVRRGE